jgi:putative Ca2+/H+ antiporter (TMEM165/GDT1 family)
METFTLNLPPLFIEWFTPISTSYALIIAAEIGDKSQLVCMSLAARHRATPVILGAIAAFALLNTLAVMFGVAIANWVPDYIVASVVAILFALFGLHAVFFGEEDSEGEGLPEKSSHGIFLTTFLLITVAEFADKTQLAVVALSSTALPLAIWVGATLALATTTIIGVAVGRSLLNKMPLPILHKVGGLMFIALAGIAAYKAVSLANMNFDFIYQFLPTEQ